MRSVRDVALTADSSHVWAVTNGGAFRMSLRDTSEPVLTLRTTNGLTENDLTSVAAGSDGNIYFGGRTGGFDVYNEQRGAFLPPQTDIHFNSLPLKAINGILVDGDRVYLSTSYGLSIYRNASEGFFETTVLRFATLPAQDSAAATAVNGDFVYVLLREGLVYAHRNDVLNDYRVWTLLPTDTTGKDLTVFNGTTYVATADHLYRVTPANALEQVSLPADVHPIHLRATSDSLYVLDAGGRVVATHNLVDFSSQLLAAQAEQLPTSIAVSARTLVAGTVLDGVAVWDFGTEGFLRRSLFPNSPVTNTFTDLTFASATDRLYVTYAGGVSVFDPEANAWTNYEGGKNDVPSFYYGNVLYDSLRNQAWISAGGIGVYAVKHLGFGKPEWQRLDHSNGIASYENSFVPNGKGIVDRTGRFALPVWGSQGEGISLTSDGNRFVNYFLDDRPRPWGCMTQDMNGTYWVGTIHFEVPSSYGVFWSTENNSSHGSIAGGTGTLLANTAVNAILTDQDNGIWCGNEGGVQIISNPETVLGSNPKFIVRTVKLVQQQLVHCMAVDGVGNKWIGTENGIFVVSPDGADSIAHFSRENSPLLDNVVMGLAIDTRRGEAYASTPSGISRFSTIFKAGRSDYSSIRVYPNPLVQSAEDSPTLFVDGLVAGSTVKIFTLAGKMVVTINGTALGSTVQWNGRDDAGRVLPSGVYLVSATSPQAGDNGEAKLVIVRKP
jgi:hypothetical protein